MLFDRDSRLSDIALIAQGHQAKQLGIEIDQSNGRGQRIGGRAGRDQYHLIMIQETKPGL